MPGHREFFPLYLVLGDGGAILNSNNVERIQAPGRNTTTMVLPEGSRVKDYKISYLASGGMSVVYRGQKDGKSYVLKEVPSDNSTQVLSLTQEKGLLERLDHPGIVNFHSLFEDNGYYYLVLEFVDGTDMTQIAYRPDNRPTEKSILDWGIQLCEIFSYLHSQNPPIIYRDLKPENLILGKDGKIVLIDFGIARVHKGDREHDTELMGSVLTASPEHYGGSETDFRSDIYTLGATLYCFFTRGQRRNTGPFQFAPVRQLNPKVSRATSAVLSKALSFKPEDRFQSMTEMAEALCGAQRGENPEPQPEHDPTVPLHGKPTADLGAEATPPPTEKKRKALIPILLLLIVLGAAGFGLKGYLPSKGGDGGQHTHHHAFPLVTEKLFQGTEEQGTTVVSLGEELPLFPIIPQPEADFDPVDRAKTIAQRFNKLYAKTCPLCGDRALSARDIRIAKYRFPAAEGEEPKEDVVLFYAHIDDGKVAIPPRLLLTISKPEAERLGTSPRRLGYYWRDITRDVLSFSRAEPGTASPVGKELTGAFLEARQNLGPEPTLDNLREVLKQVGLSRVKKLRGMILEVPEVHPADPDPLPKSLEQRNYFPMLN